MRELVSVSGTNCPKPKRAAGLKVRAGIKSGGVDFGNHSRTVLRVGRPRIAAAAGAAVEAHFEARRQLQAADRRLKARAIRSALSEVMGEFAEPIRRGVGRG